MKRIKPRRRVGRNELCPCGSFTKFKYCHGRNPGTDKVIVRKQYIDNGESPIRWVISNETGTAFFSDIQNKILVFADRQLALDVVRLELFSDAGPNDINLAGVGPTKWKLLQDTLPFIEVDSFELAQALLTERITGKRAELEITQEEVSEFEIPQNQDDGNQ